MKVDKETLIKHRFWIALGAYGLLWLLLLLMLPLMIGSSASAARTIYKKANDDVDKIKNPPSGGKPGDFANEAWTDPIRKKEEELSKRKVEVWKVAWETQKDLMTWPGDDLAPLNTDMKDAYFLDPIPDSDKGTKAPLKRDRFSKNLYRPQFDELKEAIFPAYYQGDYETILRPVTTWSTDPPGNDECWLAQEDFWIKRDLIYSLRDAIATVAYYTPDTIDPKKEPAPAGATVRRFHNANWEVTLLLEEDSRKRLTISPKSTIKNINADRRRLPLAGVLLQITQFAPGSSIPRGQALLLVEGEPLKWGETVEVKKSVLVDNFTRQDPLMVQQVFNWYTSPVKRLDRLEVGTHLALSHRMTKYGLQTKSSSKEDTSEPAPDLAGGGGMMGGARGPAGGMMMSGASGGKGGAADQNGVERKRYLDFSDQVRRVPVGMVLVVDQGRIPDVLTALTNSRLHVWVTQWQWSHVGGISAPPTESSPGEEPREVAGGKQPASPMGGGKKPGMPMAPGMMGPPMAPGGGSGGGYMGTIMGPRPGMGAGGAGGPRMGGGLMPGMMRGMGGSLNNFFSGAGEGVEPDDPNLVELVVYGIASLYERYPPKQPTDANANPPKP
jgi:hypothetical protein